VIDQNNEQSETESVRRDKAEQLRSKAINLIEQFLINRKFRQKARKMRPECAKLPYPCRKSFVMMWQLKMNTERFKGQVGRFATTYD